MPVPRKNVEFAKVIAYDRWRDVYLMGGNWNPFLRTSPTDCSGAVVDECDAIRNGTAMAWTRHGMSTEAWRPPSMGGNADPNNGPFGSKMVNHPSEFPPDAALLIGLHHGDGSPADSHMWCEIDPGAAAPYLTLHAETNGDDGTVLNDGARYADQVLSVRDTSYANNWWYIAGPIVEDGTPACTGPSSPATPTPDSPSIDTLFADVSEWQGRPVDDSYPYRAISIRSNDGNYHDKLFAQNLEWCKSAANAGKLTVFLVYFVWRPGVDNVATLQAMVGDPHPAMAIEVDIESWGGQITGDQSDGINADRQRLIDWLGGNPLRVGGYGNRGDLDSLWPNKPDDMPIRIAGYGSNPDYPGKVAHQYTDGTGFGGGLPEGSPPWATCDMNSADGYSPTALAAAYGVATTSPAPAPAPAPPPLPPAPVDPNPPAFPKPASTAAQISDIWDQVCRRWATAGGNTIAENAAIAAGKTQGK